MEVVFISSIDNALDNRDVSTTDIPGDLMQANMYEKHYH